MTQEQEKQLAELYFVKDQFSYMKSCVESILSEQRLAVLEEERQFVLNILDGIDIADKEMGVIGCTQAIRQALQSRI